MSGERDKAKTYQPPSLDEQLGDMIQLSVFAVVVSIGAECFGWATALDTFLVCCFAVAILVVQANAFQYIRGTGDRLGAILAMMMGASATIVIAACAILFFYFAPELPPLVTLLLEQVMSS